MRPRADGDASRRRLRLLDEQLAGSTSAATTEVAAAASTVAARPPAHAGRPGAQVDAAPAQAAGTPAAAAPDAAPAQAAGTPAAVRTRSASSNADVPPDSGAGQMQPPAGGGRHVARSLPWHHRLGGALADRVPTGAHGLTTAHVTVLALVGLGAVAVALWWLLGARPQPSPVADIATIEAPALVGSPAAPAAGLGTASTAPLSTDSPVSTPASGESPTTAGPGGEVVVDVAGKVRRPGIVTLPAGSRVADALQAAGGVRPGVDTAALNLARPLVDGEQVLVGLPALAGPAPGVAPGSSPTAGTTVLVDLNTATMEQLDTLPGVGPVTGQAILDWRAEHGGFTSVDELLEVDGIGDATLADLRDLVTV